MADKAHTALSDSYGNVDLTNTNTNYATVFADSDLRTRLWSELVTRDAREKNVFAKFIGSEGSGKPIVSKTDLSAGGSDKVTFTTVAPIRGIGVRGEAVLKNNTGSLNFGTFSVEVDLMRHAVAWTQVLKLMRFTGKTLDQLSAEVMSEWAARIEQDHVMQVLRDTCLSTEYVGTNVIKDYGAGGAAGVLEYVDGLSTDIIQEAKQALIAQGGQPMNVGGDQNQEIPGYLFFAPDAALRPLRSDPDYLEAITQADARGADNALYSGHYVKWDNNVIANHNLLIDTALGRQGSPLAPTARLKSAVTLANDSGDTVFLGDGDAFANFPTGDLAVPGGGGMGFTALSGTQNVLIVNGNGDVGHFVVTVTDNGTLTCAQDSFNDGSTGGTDQTYDAASNSIDEGDTITAGSMIYLANSLGTPIAYALAMGEGALYIARGAVTNEQIFHYDDFANSGNSAHLNAIGVQSVYGLAAYEDTNDRIPGVQLVECVRQLPGITISQ